MKFRSFVSSRFVQVVIVLFLLEGGIRVASFLKDKVFNPLPEKRKGIVTILCVGDSVTEGLGAPKEYSYPAQLQKLLDTKCRPDKFKVINIGKGGMNSSQVLSRFPGNMTRYHPDIIVVMIGINDSWNLNGSNIWMFGTPSRLNALKLNVNLALSKIKVYQFIKLMIISIQRAGVPEYDEARHMVAKRFEQTEEKRAQLYNLLAYDTNQIVAIARKSNARIFLQSYQKEGIGNIRILLNQVYRYLNVPIVDNQTLFEEAQSRGLKVISQDNFHPNKDGYALIAKNVYNTLVKQGIIHAKEVSYF